MIESDRRFVREISTIRYMSIMYCGVFHRPGLPAREESLCEHCRGFLNYARERLLKCPFGTGKPACSECHNHCYRPQERETAKIIMKYAGPKMTKSHPLLVLQHLWHKFRSKSRIEAWKKSRLKATR